MSIRVVLGGLGLSGVLALSACGPHVEGHSVATHTPADSRHIDASAVRVSALSVPSNAAELGIVQAHTVGGSIEDAMPAFREQVADLGGDFGKVNDIKTTFEMRTVTSTESYNCGSADKPSTCSRTVTRQVELVTTRLLGKAYRLGAGRPPAPAPAAAPVPAESAPAAPATPAAPAAAPPAPPAGAAPPPPAAAPSTTPPAAPPTTPGAASFPTAP